MLPCLLPFLPSAFFFLLENSLPCELGKLIGVLSSSSHPSLLLWLDLELVDENFF